MALQLESVEWKFIRAKALVWNITFTPMALALRWPLRRQRGDSILFHGQRGSLKKQYNLFNRSDFNKRHAFEITENIPGI